MNECDKDMNLAATSSVTSIPPLMGDDEDGFPAEPPGAPPLPLCQDGTPMYKYRDFGHIEEDEEGANNSDIPAPAQSNRGSSESSIRVQKFPVKLYAILAQKEFHDIICWMPHGRSWKVLKPSMFESLVMPLFFEYSNYHSFNRLVNAWSFRRISAGPDRGSYYHELFLRGKPHLQNYMRRLPKTHKKLPMKKKNEPDFYKLDQANPLPAIHEAPIPGAAATVQAMRAGVPPQGVSSDMPMMTPMTQQSHLDTTGSNPMIVTPNMSPNHSGPSIIGDNYSGHSSSGMGMGGSSMNGFGNMSSMGNGSMMNSMNSMSPDTMGMGGMSGMNSMNGMGVSGMNGMSSMSSMNGMGMSGMNSMSNMTSGSMGGMGGSSSMGMNQNYMPSSSMYGSSSGGSFNPRYSGYSDNISDTLFDDYDCTPSQAMMGSGGSSMRGQQPQHMGAMMNNDYIDNYGYDKMGPSMSSIRRPIPVRQGGSMDQMSGLRSSGSSSQLRQSDNYYSGYSQSSNMMNGMQGQSDMYSRSGSTSLPSLLDEFVPTQGSSSNGPSDSNNAPIRASEN